MNSPDTHAPFVHRTKTYSCRRGLFLTFMSSGFQGNGQGKKQIFECQRYSLLQARLNRRDADDKKIENCSVTQLHRHRIKGLC